ncbi:TOMM precursor leader peptide-binding protein [Streptomyces sp. NPDC048419]|uniref:TOMM precursor leader peptide-binding protein n=1 Tax=Streptomyces sp. NPDC048419 TaxID=3365547 RepID=UPI0037107028
MTATGGSEPRAGEPLVGDLRVGFKKHLRVEVVPGEAAYLVSAQGVTALRGADAEALAPLLDGTRTLSGILAEASHTVPPPQAEDAIRRLAEAGLVRAQGADGADEALWTPAAPDADEAYWDLAGLDGARAAARVAATSVRLRCLDGVDPDEVAEACAGAGLRVSDGPAALALVVCGDYLDPALLNIDAAQRARGQPWLLAKPGGFEPWTGPVLRPDGGPCWSCLAHRLRGHRRSERPLQRALGLAGPVPRPTASPSAGRGLGLQIAVLEAAKWLAGVRYDRQDAVFTYNTLTLRGAGHEVRRRPQCPQCGAPELVAERVAGPVVLRSRPKGHAEGNGHRSLTPSQFLHSYGHLVGPVTGIVRDIQRDPAGPGFVDCYLSGQNLAVDARTLAGLRAGLRDLSGGKGLSPLEARASALGEAVERYCGSRHGDEPVVRDTLRALGDAALHPNACQLYDRRQYRDREAWNRTRSHFQYVPRPFDEDRPTDWTPVWSLTEETHRLLPTSLLYFDADAGPDSVGADSNGNAAGSSLEDALVQGFMELVERDAVALWWYNRTRHAAVDLDAFDAPWTERIKDGCRRVNREVWALDLTSDLGVPVVAALSRRTDKPAEDVVFGFGAHFDPRIALRRALTEMAQLLPAAAGARADGTGYTLTDPELRTWWQHATFANQPYLQADPLQTPRTPDHWTHTPRADLADDVEDILALTRRHGLELLVLDQTRPDIGLPVVKVIVPGLRHFWARFAPGRLYDVPVRTGRLATPTPYEQLNPIPLFV